MTPADALVVPPPDAGTHDTASDRDGPGVQLFRQRADELAEADAAGAIELWRSAVRAHPDSSEARWALIEAYFQTGNPKRAGRALLRAYRRGLPDFATALLTRAPGHAPAELYEQAMHDPALAFAAATGLVETGDPAAALPYLEARLTAKPGNHGGGFMLVSLVIRALSRLGEQGELAGFERLARLFSEYSKHEEVPVWGPYAAQWLVLRELAVTTDTLPRVVFRALAASVVRQDASRLSQRLRSYTEEHPSRARHAQHVLETHAPALYNTYGALLKPVDSGPPRGRSWLGIPWILFAFLAFRGVCHSQMSQNRAVATDASPDARSIAAPRTAPPPAPEVEVRYSQTSVDRAVSNLAWLAQDHDLPELGIGAATVGEAFPGDCAPLARGMETLVGLTRRQDAGIITEVQSLFIEFERACPLDAKMVPKP